MQALAERGVLQDFAYLSTVSGGGYIGSWLSSWIRRHGRNFDAVARKLGAPEKPTGHPAQHATTVSLASEPQEPFETEPGPIHHLRKYSNYLTPALGLLSGDGWAVAATVVRNLLLNWTLIIPAVLLVLLVPRLALALELAGTNDLLPWQALLYGVMGFGAGVYSLSHLLSRQAKSERKVLLHCIFPLVTFCALGTVMWFWGASFQSAEANPYLTGWAAILQSWAAHRLSILAVPLKLGAQLLTRVAHSHDQRLAPHFLRLYGDVAWGSATALLALFFASLRSKAKLESKKLFVRLCALVVVFGLAGAGIWWVGENAADGLAQARKVQIQEEAAARDRRSKDSSRNTAQAKRERREAIFVRNRAAEAAMLLSADPHFPGLAVLATLPTYLVSSMPHGKEGAATAVEGKHWALLSRKIADDTLEQWVAVEDPKRTPVQDWFRKVFEGPRPRNAAEIRLNIAVLCVCFGFPILLAIVFVANTVLTGLLSRKMLDEDREWLARASGWAFLLALASGGLSLLVLHGPAWLVMLWDGWPKMFAAVGGISGALTILGSRSDKVAASSRDDKKPGTLSWLLDSLVQLAAPIFVAILIMLFSLLTTLLLQKASHWTEVSPRQHWTILQDTNFPVLFGAMFLFLSVSFISNYCVNINKFSLHAMYRNRLIRAYLGATNRFRNPNRFTGFDSEDNLPMSDLREQRPYHVLSAALNLVGGADLAWQQRLATSFVFTPWCTGSTILGFRDSSQYAKTANPNWVEAAPETASPDPEKAAPEIGVTLGTAMAISGAAVSPNHGYNSSPLIAFLLTFFNARLGGWFGNPGAAGAKTWTDEAPQFALSSLVAEAFGMTDAQHRYVNLSDGGHFENLGLYEMVMRRCRLIVVSDAGCDPDYSFEDLGNAIAKIRVDFGIPIEFTPDIGIRKYNLKKADRGIADGRHCAIARIRYSAVDRKDLTDANLRDGWLVYIKPAMCGSESMDVFHYYREHPEFPHESTTDQWFTESQFESYRMLGYHSVAKIWGDKEVVGCGTEKDRGLEGFVRRAIKYAAEPAGR